MGKVSIDSNIPDAEDFESEQDLESAAEKVSTISKDMRRRLEDRLAEMQLSRQLSEYNYKDI